MNSLIWILLIIAAIWWWNSSRRRREEVRRKETERRLQAQASQKGKVIDINPDRDQDEGE